VAVVQISRIQVRRGKKDSESGLPQLASGEFGWAIDTQELYIGNGAVSEGAPAVGNTKVITEKDNIFDFATVYEYKREDPAIVTGSDSSSPVSRSLQDRLDDTVSINNFITQDNVNTGDYTSAIQRAIIQLFLKNGVDNEGYRFVLHFGPGVYTITDTVFIPSNTVISGAGKDKTIIRQQSSTSKPIFKTVGDESDYTNSTIDPADSSFFDTDNQPKNIRIEKVTLENTTDHSGLVLQGCRQSSFKEIKIKGNWTSGITEESRGIWFEETVPVDTHDNLFEDVQIEDFSYAVKSEDNIKRNRFNQFHIDNTEFGVVFFDNETENVIENSFFDRITRHAVWIDTGTYNISRNNHYGIVGYNGSDASSNTKYSIIRLGNSTNISTNDSFDKIKELSYNQSYINNEFGTVYEGEIFGSDGHLHKVDVTTTGNWIKIFRLPGEFTSSYKVDYLYKSIGPGRNMIRSGTLDVLINREEEKIHLVDEYDFQGADQNDAENLEFRAEFDIPNDAVNIEIQNSTLGEDENSNVQFSLSSKQ